MSKHRCPYHVKQGFVDGQGKLVLSDICGVKSACGGACRYFPFDDHGFKQCPFLQAQTLGQERHMLIPKDDIEYLPEFGGLSGMSELDLM